MLSELVNILSLLAAQRLEITPSTISLRRLLGPTIDIHPSYKSAVTQVHASLSHFLDPAPPSIYPLALAQTIPSLPILTDANSSRSLVPEAIQFLLEHITFRDAGRELIRALNEVQSKISSLRFKLK